MKKSVLAWVGLVVVSAIYFWGVFVLYSSASDEERGFYGLIVPASYAILVALYVFAVHWLSSIKNIAFPAPGQPQFSVRLRRSLSFVLFMVIAAVIFYFFGRPN